MKCVVDAQEGAGVKRVVFNSVEKKVRPLQVNKRVIMGF